MGRPPKEPVSDAVFGERHRWFWWAGSKSCGSEAELTIDDICRELEIENTSWGNWERGAYLLKGTKRRPFPRADELERICERFNVSADWLIGRQRAKDETQELSR
jgi:transcriptional regulator with XRE-family HTH domain